LAVAADTLSKAAAQAPDEQTRNANYRNFALTVGNMTANGFLDAEQNQKARMAFDAKVLSKRATIQIASNPAGFLAEVSNPESDFHRMGEDAVLKLSETARTTMEREERRSDRIANEVKQQAEQGWYSALGNNKLSDSDIQDAIDKKNPYITPEKALHFQKLKAEGIKGDKAPVTAIMSSYHAVDRSPAAIARTRKELLQLQSQVGPNDWIDKALNELQTDVSTLTTQGIALQANEIARNNREIGNLQNSLEAGKAPMLPALRQLLPNTDQVDKAKVKEIYQKDGKAAAEAFVKDKVEQKKSKVESIPPQTKKVLELP
jgi:hypothetical protein